MALRDRNIAHRQSRMFAEFVTDTTGFGDASRRGDSSSRLRNPSLYMAAAHAPGDHYHSPGCTRYQMRVPAVRREFGAPEARLAAASDLLNVAKALLV